MNEVVWSDRKEEDVVRLLRESDVDVRASVLHRAGRGLRGKNLSKASWRRLGMWLGEDVFFERVVGRLLEMRTREDAMGVIRVLNRYEKGEGRRHSVGGRSWQTTPAGRDEKKGVRGLEKRVFGGNVRRKRRGARAARRARIRLNRRLRERDHILWEWVRAEEAGAIEGGAWPDVERFLDGRGTSLDEVFVKEGGGRDEMKARMRIAGGLKVVADRRYKQAFGGVEMEAVGVVGRALLEEFDWLVGKEEEEAGEEVFGLLGKQIGGALKEVTRQRRGIGGVSDEVMGVLERRGLKRLARYCRDPFDGMVLNEAVVDLEELAGLVWLERQGAKVEGFTVDTGKIAARVVEVMSEGVEGKDWDEVCWSVGGVMRFMYLGERADLQRVLDGGRGFARSWWCFLWVLLGKLKLLPNPRSATSVDDRIMWGVIGHGSELACEVLHGNVSEGYAGRKKRMEGGYRAWRSLLAGCGRYEQTDYPDFRLTARAKVAMVTDEVFDLMRKLASELAELRGDIYRDWQEGDMFNLLLKRGIRYGQFCGRDSGEGSAGLNWGDLSENCKLRICEVLGKHAMAYVVLKQKVLTEQMLDEGFRIRRRHVARFWRDFDSGVYGDIKLPDSKEALLAFAEREVLIEGMVHALMSYLGEVWEEGNGSHVSLKEEFVYGIRVAGLCYGMEENTFWIDDRDVMSGRSAVMARRLADFLVGRFRHGFVELASGLRLGAEQNLPLLNGGRRLPVEGRFREVLKKAAGSKKVLGDHEALVRYKFETMGKEEALGRGNMGGDCSSEQVPLRCLSPHHVYYRIWEVGTSVPGGRREVRGYVTVFEAWALDERGGRKAVLCLETVNVPGGQMDGALGDLLAVLEGVAVSRGLYERVVVVTDCDTWNYGNEDVMKQSRRFRQGKGVWLSPADPVMWRLYDQAVPGESRWYSPFEADEIGCCRVLAKQDLEEDLVEAENEVEIERLKGEGRGMLRITGWGKRGVEGFVSV